MLRFNRPIDDGGLPVLEYVVYRRNHDENFSTDWKHHISVDSTKVDDLSVDIGTECSIRLTNLLPDCSYDFKIFAKNVAGIAKESVTSNEIHLPSTNQIFSPTYVLRGNVGEGLESASSLLLNDTAQTISYWDENHNKVSINVWSSHYSPKKFSVEGIPIYMESPASAVLETADIFNGKIAVIARDGEPISTKARHVQSAGAIGCIVLDAGNCIDFDQKCFPGSHKERGEFFGEVDPPKAWSPLRIPVVFALNNENSRQLFHSFSIIDSGK